MARVSLVSRDDNDIDLELGNRVGYVEELRGKMMELDRKKEQEDVQRRLNEISIKCHQSDDSGKKDKDSLWKRPEELIAEFYEIKDGSTSGLDLGAGNCSSGGAGPTQDVGASMSKNGGQHQEGRKTDDVKWGGTEGNQSCESRSAHVEGNGEDVFEEASDSWGDIFEQLDYILAEGVFTNVEGLEVREPIKKTIQEMEKLEGDAKKGKDGLDMGSDCTETEEESQELEKESVKKRFLDNIAKSGSSDDLEHPVATDTEEISTNIVGLDQELKNIVQERQKDMDEMDETDQNLCPDYWSPESLEANPANVFSLGCLSLLVHSARSHSFPCLSLLALLLALSAYAVSVCSANNGKISASEILAGIGTVTTVCLLLVPIRNMMKIWEHKSVQQTSPRPYIAMFLISLFGVLYALTIGYPEISLSLCINGLGLFLGTIYLLIFCWFDEPEGRKRTFYGISIGAVAFIVTAYVAFMVCTKDDYRPILVAWPANVTSLAMCVSHMIAVHVAQEIDYYDMLPTLVGLINAAVWMAYGNVTGSTTTQIASYLEAIPNILWLRLYWLHFRSPQSTVKDSLLS